MNKYEKTNEELLQELQELKLENESIKSAYQKENNENKLINEKVKQLACIVESSEDAIISKTFDGIITSWNKGAEKLYGYTEKEIIGRSISILIPPEQINEIPQIVERIKVGEHIKHYETQRLKKGGQIIFVSLTISPINDNDGNIIGVSIISRDITERKRFEELKLESDERLRFAMGISGIGLWDLDLIDHTAFRSLDHDKIFGYQELLPVWTYEKFIEHVFPDDREIVESKFHRSIETLSDWNFECRIIRTDGEVRWIWAAGRHIIDNGSTVNRIAGIVQDITERKIAENALKESEEKYRNLFNNSEIGMFRSRLDGSEIFELNPRYLDILGYTHEEIKGYPSMKLWVNKKELEMMVERLKADGYIKELECDLINKSGEVRRCITSLKLYPEQEILEGSIYDITDRKKVEEALERSERELKRAQDITHIGNWSLDFATNQVVWSEELYKIYGFDPTLPPPLLNVSSTLFTPESWELLLSSIAKTRETGNPYEIELRLMRYDGSNGWMWARGEAVKDNDGKIVGLWSVVQDITDRKKAEEEIKNLNRMFLVLSNVNQAIVRIRDKNELFNNVCKILIDDGKFYMSWIGILNTVTNKLDVTASAGKIEDYLDNVNIDMSDERQSGGPTGRAVQTGTIQFSSFIQDDSNMTPWRERALSLGYKSSLALPLKVFGKVCGAFTLYSGEVDFFNDNEIKLLEKLANNLSFAIEFIEIDKERNRAEEALIENEKKLRSILENTDAGYFFIDKDGIIKDVNNAWVRLYGYDSANEIIGHHFVEVQNIVDVEHVIEFVNGIINNNKNYLKGEFSRKLKNGTIGYHSFSANPVARQGEVIGIEGFIIDTTEKKKAEVALLESETNFRSLFENMTEGVALHEMIYNDEGYPIDYRIIDVNSAYEKFTQISRSDAIGILATEIYGTDTPPYLEEYYKVVKTKIPYFFETHFQPMNKDFSISVISSKTDHFATIFMDITESKNAEEALRNSETRFKLAVSSGSLGIWDWNVKDNVMLWDDRMFELYGIERDTFTNNIDAWMNGLHPEDKQRAIDECNSALYDDKEFDTVFRVLHSDGKVLHLKANGLVIKDKDGKPIRMLGINSDITERLKVEEELKESELHYRTLFENMLDGFIHSRMIFENDIPIDYEVLNVNPAYEIMTGLNGLIGKKISEVIPNYCKDNPESLEVFGSVAKTGVPRRWEHYLPNLKRWFSFAIYSPFQDEFVCVFDNITDRKMAENAIKSNEERFRRISNISSDIAYSCIISNEESYFIDWMNGAAEQITGYIIDEIKDMKCWGKLVIADDIQLFNKYVIGLRPGDSASCELRLRNKKGNIVWVKSKAECFLDERQNNIKRLFGGLVDITDQKKAEDDIIRAKEKAEESDKLKTAFLQNMSHEIRTPLNGIIGFSDLLQNDDLSKEEIKEFTSIIKNSGNRLIEIVNNVLDISKIETGQMSINIKAISINSMMSELYSFFSPMTNDKDIILNYHTFLKNENCFIDVDDNKLNQIFTNLINNAIKFTSSGVIDFGYEIKNNEILFFVKDTGIGIAAEFHDRIFERFVQADLSLSRGYEGAGLGLAICKGLVTILGGKIWFESEKDKGSTFYFTMPLKFSTYIQNFSDSINSLIPNNLNLKILIAEDDTASFQYLKNLLKGDNIVILFAENGQQAVDLVRDEPDIDLILMDIRMPVMDGLEATLQIKKIRPDLPIIAQTAYAFSAEKEKFISIGCDDYIVKPIDRNKLFRIIEKNILKHKK